MATFSTAVRIIRVSASSSSASSSEAKSLSMTAAAPLRWLPSVRNTGMPPPPQQMTIWPSLLRARMAPASMMCLGLGEATYRRQPRPESSLKEEAGLRRHLLGLFLGEELADGLGGRLKGGVVGVHLHLRHHGDDGLVGDAPVEHLPPAGRSGGRSRYRPGSWAPQTDSGVAPWVWSSCIRASMALLMMPTWGPLPWATMTWLPSSMRSTMARAVIFTAVACSGRVVPRALPPRAMTMRFPIISKTSLYWGQSELLAQLVRRRP